MCIALESKQVGVSFPPICGTYCHSRLFGVENVGPCSYASWLVGLPGSRQKGGQGLWLVDSHDWVGLSTSSLSLRIEIHLDPGSIPKRMLAHGLRALDPHKRGGTWGDQGLLATKATP